MQMDQRSTENISRFEYAIALAVAVIAGFAYCGFAALSSGWRKARRNSRLHQHAAQVRNLRWPLPRRRERLSADCDGVIASE
jgi:hypothetical protein